MLERTMRKGIMYRVGKVQECFCKDPVIVPNVVSGSFNVQFRTCGLHCPLLMATAEDDAHLLIQFLCSPILHPPLPVFVETEDQRHEAD